MLSVYSSQFFAGIARANHRKAAVFQQLTIPTAIKHRWRIRAEPFFEPLGVFIICPADYPDTPFLPAIDGLSKQKSALQQRNQSA